MEFKFSETDIVVRLGHELIMEKIPFVCEHKISLPNRGLYADIAIHTGARILCLIEVKNHKKQKHRKVTKQETRYQQTGIPYLYCRSLNEIPGVINDVCKMLRKERTA